MSAPLNAETTNVHADCRTYLQGSQHFKTAITFDAKQTLKSEAKIKMSHQSLMKDLLHRYKILVHLRQFYNEEVNNINVKLFFNLCLLSSSCSDQIMLFHADMVAWLSFMVSPYVGSPPCDNCKMSTGTPFYNIVTKWREQI